MLPGPIEYYKCPGCGTVLCKSLPASLNNFIITWSDGTINEHLLNKSDLTRCTTCSHLFWQSRQEVVYIQLWSYWIDLEKGLCESNPYPYADYPASPSVDEYSQAIENSLADSLGHKIYLCKMFWWFLNDRVRKKNSYFILKEKKHNAGKTAWPLLPYWKLTGRKTFLTWLNCTGPLAALKKA